MGTSGMSADAELLYPLDAKKTYERRVSGWRREVRCSCSRLSHWVDTFADDVIDFHKNIGTITTAKILVGVAPFYMGVRAADKTVHGVFYCGKRHKNLHQPPRGITNFLNYGVPTAMIGVPLLTLFSRDESLSAVGRVFAITLPFVWVEKNILKKIFKVDANCRPYNEHFPRKKVYGGCPSGHMVFACYATTLFGLQRGPAWGVPMGLFTAAVFLDFIVTNRHYASQMILGTGLGIIYGFAASKTVDYVRNVPITCSMGSTEKGYPAVNFSFRY
jgi:hypothetical protein